MAKKTFFQTAGVGLRATLILLLASLLIMFLRGVAFVQFLLTPGLGILILIGLIFLGFWIQGWFLLRFKKFIFGKND